MSIFSSIGNFVSSAASSVGNFFSNAYNTISGIFGGGGTSNTASVGNLGSGGTRTAGFTPVPVGPAYGNAVGMTPVPSGGAYSAGPVYGPQLPATINAGAQNIKSGSSSSSGGSSGGASFNAYGPVAPTTISAKSLGVNNPAAKSSGTSGMTTLSSTGGGATPISLASAPTSVGTNGIDNTRLAGSMAGYYTLNKDGQFEPVKTSQGETDLQTAQDTKRLYDEILGTKPTVAQDPEVMAARNQRQQIQQALLAPTSELNAVLAKQKQDLLQLRQTGSKEGVTEAVYGGQENAINYNAAIRALPLQASISSLQGDLKLAQDYLTELTQVKQDQINNQYEYNKNLFNAISQHIDKKDQRAYDEMKTANERAYQTNKDLIETQAKLLQNAIAKKAPQPIINAINSSRDIRSAVEAAGTYGTGVTSTTNNAMTDNERALMTQFRGEQIVKDYNDILGQKGTIDAYIQNGVGGPADLALVFSFMKGLDPTSVVREAEYDTAAKSGNIFQGAFTKFNGYFKEKGGFLPKNVKTEFQNLVNQKLAVKQKQYDNVKSQYEAIASRQGLNAQNVVIDYASGGAPTGTQPAAIPKESNISNNAYVEKVLSSQGLNYQSVIDSVPAGQKAVIDNKTGKIGYIPFAEFDSTIYTPI